MPQKLIKKLFASILALFFSAGYSNASEYKNAYDFSFYTANGEEFPLAQFKGKVLLIVNTASKCGFTSQYKSLQELYSKYKDQGLMVIGIPSNDFGDQEPGTNSEIQNFCQINFGVSFPVLAKETVVGKNAHPFYQWAQQQLGFGTAPKWNFHKYVINRHGQLVDYFNSPTAPKSEKVISLLEKLLADS